jgi:hypothetical protein
MKYDPQQRPTASQTLQYPFFQVRRGNEREEGREEEERKEEEGGGENLFGGCDEGRRGWEGGEERK